MRRLRSLTESPLRLGLAISGVLLLGLFASETLLQRWPGIAAYSAGGALARQTEGILRDLRIAVVHCLLAGYLPAALLAVVQGGRQTVLSLQRALDCSPEECRKLADSMRLNPWIVAGVVLIGLTVAYAGPFIVPPVPETPWNPVTWSPEVAWHRVLGPLLGALAATLAYAIVALSRRMSRLASDLSRIDLLDLTPLLPFTQQGLTNALLLVGFVSIAGLTLLTETGFGLLALVSGGPVLAAAGMAFVLPLRGVHRRIRSAKQTELAWVDARIRGLGTVLRGRTGGHDGELADLAAYRDLIRDVQEWPISAGAYLRFAFYMLIPVISWAAAALMERVIDAIVS